MRKQYFIIIIIYFYSLFAQAQFSVSAVANNEECPGTGSLTLSVQNANPSAPVNYKVYLQPEINVPFWNSSDPYVQGLQDGSYLIKATQVVNGNTVTATTQATVGSNYVPLAFSISSVNAVCGNDGTMVINVTAGSPQTYEILDGPATAPPQPSNVFNGLPAGTYQVRVTDTCGNGYISTQTFYVEQPVLALDGPVFDNNSLPACNQITVGYTASVQGEGLGIIYPLTVKIRVYPPGGGNATVYNQTISGGPETSVSITQTIAYYTSSYTIDCEVTDPCGTVYTLNNNTIDQPMTASASVVPVLCGESTLSIAPKNFMPPFTINFITTPAGFNPGAFNAAYPGPYTGADAVFGSEGNPVPLGTYTFTVTDACGRTGTGEIEVTEPVIPEPQVAGENHDCINFMGSVNISIANHPLQTATITSAPAGYAQQLPYNCTALIVEGVLTVEDMPQGNYSFTLTDVCGNTYNDIAALVPEYSLQEPQYVLRPDCTPGNGSLLILSDVTSVKITAAPAGFSQPLPYDVSFNIVNGLFSMDNLPAGTYTFNASTVCAQDISKVVEIPGFTVTEDVIELAGNCVNFDLNVNYVSNAGNLVTFWLQAYNDELNTWMHPETGVLYTEGEPLTEENALRLQNEAVNEDLPYIGEFRVLKSQKSYANGSQGSTIKNCIEEYYEFNFYNILDIRGIYNLTCVGEIIDVQVDAVGVSPLHYEIISKNSDSSFYIDNGQSNTFYGLEGAFYVVRVTDPCGGYRVEQFNVSELPPLVSATQPSDMGWCDLSGAGAGTFDLTTQTPVIIDDIDPEIITITYHTSLEDAEQDMNAIQNPASYTSGSATIFARVEWNVNRACYGIAQFNLNVAPPGELAMRSKWAFCPGHSVTVEADPGYVSYLWSTGATTPSIEISEAGTYTVTVVSNTTCEISKTITVLPATPPVISRIDINDWTDDENSVAVIMQDQENADLYEYSIDGINFQDSNTFITVPAGQYTLTVRDKFGCQASYTKDIHLLTYPKFFTPNGDGVHDKWRIEYAILEPNMKIFIYDRYGKPITAFGPASEGWDGTLEGQKLPSTDYWFTVQRQDGREFRGHFSMVR